MRRRLPLGTHLSFRLIHGFDESMFYTLQRRENYRWAGPIVLAVLALAGRAVASEGADPQITVAVFGWSEDLRVAADAYREIHPRSRFRLLVHESRKMERFRLGQVDLLAYVARLSGYVGGEEIERFPEAFPSPLEETIVAYRPLAVFVHPQNPVEKFDREQLRLLTTKRRRTWKDLGREEDGPVRIYVFHSSHAATAILRKPDSGSVLRSYWPPVRMAYENRVLEALAEDRDGMALWYRNRQFAASGLKAVALVPENGGASVGPSDAPAVASGRYWLRVPLKITVHPEANEDVRRFAHWLTTREAARAMLDAHQRLTVPAAYPSPIAHVTLAAEDVPTVETNEVPVLPASGLPAVEVDGAVAVLPIEPLSMYFLMADAADQAFYEHTIFEAIEADGRLEPVDRTEIRRILRERELQLLNPQGGPANPAVAADVLVLSYVVTRGMETCLRVDAVHGPTACRLGRLELPIDPADPLRFSPPLSESVSRWWSHALERLAAARTRPIWTLTEVYAADAEALDEAAALRQALEAQLSADPRIFFAPRVPLSWSQQEVWMQLTGLSRSQLGRFGPAADYLIEARLSAPTRVQIRLLSGHLARLAGAELVGKDRQETAREVAAWLGRRISESLDRQPAIDVASVSSDDWAREQARLEIALGKQLRAEAYRLERVAHTRNLEGDTVRIPPEEARRIEQIQRRARGHLQRAGQLAPTWEEAAREALGDPAELFRQIHETATPDGNRPLPLGEELKAYERFLATFPNSKHAEQVLQTYTRGCLAFARKAKLPPTINDRPVRVHFYRAGLDGYRRYMEEYFLPGKADPEYAAYMNFYHYLYWLREYLEYAETDEAESTALVADWARRYDAHPDRAPDSAFVRLVLLACKEDRAGFLELLTSLQKRWPDPAHPQWQDTAGLIDEAIFRLFRGVDSSNNSFQLWCRGRRGIGDLPAVGYKLGEAKRPLPGPQPKQASE